MILQALYDYYNRKAADPDSGIAPPGLEWKEIPFLIVLSRDGYFVDIHDTREKKGQKSIPKRFLVPKGVKRTSTQLLPNLLWDNAQWVLGIASDKPDDGKKKQTAFIKGIQRLAEFIGNDDEIAAVLSFLEKGNLSELETHSLWDDLTLKKANTSFFVQGYNRPVCEAPCVRNALKKIDDKEDEPLGLCLVTGNLGPIERVHPSIKGVRGGQPSGTNIVSFQQESFRSFRKNQGHNAPVGKEAAFSYTTALNHLLDKESRQRLIINGDTSVVFWAGQKHDLEESFADLFAEPEKDNPDRNASAVRSIYAAPYAGVLANNKDKTLFYILGLSPNASRLAIRFWRVLPVEELTSNIRRHFDDLFIVHGTREPDHLSLMTLLRATALQGKLDNLHPSITSALIKAILDGGAYPRIMLLSVLARIRAERGDDHTISYPRAAMLKAYLNRQVRSQGTQHKEIQVSLDETNNDPGYRLGRLFAVLERIQEKALPGINATIRQRYYGTAATRPTIVFPTLLNLKNHHLPKLDKGLAISFERQLGSVLGGLTDFPTQLGLEEQARFALGYYHQRQQFFSSAKIQDKGE